jgi:hypothetical protein
MHVDGQICRAKFTGRRLSIFDAIEMYAYGCVESNPAEQDLSHLCFGEEAETGDPRSRSHSCLGIRIPVLLRVNKHFC